MSCANAYKRVPEHRDVKAMKKYVIRFEPRTSKTYLVESFFEIIRDELFNGNEVMISGLGNGQSRIRTLGPSFKGDENMWNAQDAIINLAKHLRMLEKKFLDIIKYSESKSRDDIEGYFNDALSVSRESYHTLRRILILFHPLFGNFIKVKDNDVLRILKDIVEGKNEPYSVRWYESLLDIVNNSREDNQQIFLDEAIDNNLISKDKSELFKHLKTEIAESNREGIIDRDSTLFSDTDFWMDEHNVTIGMDMHAAEYWIRLREIGPIFIDKEVPKNVQEIYSEVRLNYALNRLISCLALCRATVECCIKNKLSKKFKDLSDDMPLLETIKLASTQGILSDKYCSFAHDVRKLANKVLHSKDKVIGNEDDETVLAIKKTREVIEYLCNIK